jgi:hypothetical protein
MTMIDFQVRSDETLCVETCEKSGLVITVCNEYDYQTATYVFAKRHVEDAKKFAQFILDWVDSQKEIEG